MDGLSKNDIAHIFKRLKSQSANKVCFDCGSNNPTWSSVTYGIFICIDCSGIHRSLGVHLTFVRSTVLDCNWTWVQLRQMQLGGNAGAKAFFQQYNTLTSDVQVKYKSRTAQLYREKLHNAAVQAIKIHGSKLFIESAAVAPEKETEDKEVDEDFFTQNHSNPLPENIPKLSDTIKKEVVDPTEGPNVDGIHASTVQAPRKSTIMNKRSSAKKGGLGAKKLGGGLGATKVKKDFSEIEKEAEMADQIRSKMADESTKKVDEEEITSSMRLAYHDISVQQKKKEDNLKKTDPKKAEQVERLGMGFRASSGVSHSLMSDTITIVQEEPSGYKKQNNLFVDRSSNYMDDIDTNNDDNMFKGFSDPMISWESEFEKLKMEKNTTKDKGSWGNSFSNSSSNRSSSKVNSYNGASSVEASKKFGEAKAISSDMFFDNDRNDSQDANLNRFQGSNSISSADYFNRTEVTPGSRIQSPDMEDVKESVRQGVTKVASKLSGMASGVYSQIQEKYGY
ncbi:ADP-ribosylation factor GTPase-activating protein 3 isoform X2 [Lepeophtheirus salmonis]|uniref:ADP-ribosylation factor GTPase-activating protein 3 isoform X2 n=1 Tax=Lepeophtheirus salmonis TaxID=72036 RepID=UPI001AE8A33A|nr:ADP-ribosylation factor GTPase-activating protein 3-like isoform X2 [Lepeophtheirus salmonis]